MGMYDYVDFEIECPKCKNLIKDFQTKDGSQMLSHLKFYEVDCFYSFCNNCGTWVEFVLPYEKIMKLREVLKIEDYEMIVKNTSDEDEKRFKKNQREVRDMFKEKKNNGK